MRRRRNHLPLRGLEPGAGQIAVGSYTGNTADDRNITGVGFWPEYVIVGRSTQRDRRAGQTPRRTRRRRPAVGTDGSLLFDANVFETNNVQALQADGFQVGTTAA